jgi:hypothetical protein
MRMNIEELQERIEGAKCELKSLEIDGNQIAKNRAKDHLLYLQLRLKREKRINAIYAEADAIKKELEILKEYNNEKDV